MNDEEKKLRRQQEQVSATAARKALDQGDAARALSLIENASEFWQQNLIILSSVIGFYSNNIVLVNKAYSLFYAQLRLCSNTSSLSSVALWMMNPNRTESIPDRLKRAIDSRREELDPDWNGFWDNPGARSINTAHAIMAKRPDEVCDTNDCLVAASQARDWHPWIHRYHSLCGSSENPAYLKIMVAKAVPMDKKPPASIKESLKKFTILGKISEVRSFLRAITPVRRPADGKMPNTELAKYALRLYCECKRLELTVEDWIHIAESSMYLDCDTIAQMAQHTLEKADPTPNTKEIIEKLVERYGQI